LQRQFRNTTTEFFDGCLSKPSEKYVVCNRQCNTGAPAQLIIFDPKGGIVADNTFGDGLNQIQFDVSSLPDGRFHIICKAGGQVHTTEVLKK
jgi:hypothetical protein